jgi:hypothetical protein
MRIKYSLIEKLKNLTSTEMDLFLYVAKYQRLNGFVAGVHNQDVCRATGMCKQSFYTAMRGLERKGIVKISRTSDIDYDLLILDNDFTGKEAFKAGRCKGYIDLSRSIFHKKQFKQLKAKEKWLLLYFLHCTHDNSSSYRIGTGNFYKKFCAMLGVTKRMVRSYLHSLRAFFSVGIVKGIYYITYKRSVFNQKQGEQEKQEHEFFASALLRRNKIRKYNQEALAETAKLIKQYRGIAHDSGYNIFDVLEKAVRESIPDESKPKDRKLSYKYVHKLVRETLALC